MDIEHSYFVRQAQEIQIPIFLDYAGKEGWNPAIYDYQVGFRVNSQAFLLGFIKKQSLIEEPISCINAFLHNEDFGFIGAFIVKPEHRGKKYGATLFKTAFQKLSIAKNIGLDAVLPMVSYYEKFGFKKAYNIIRYKVTGTGNSIQHHNIISMSEALYQELNDYDKNIFPGGNRWRFLRGWLAFFSDSAFIYKSEGEIRGYGILRKSQLGYNIGPFYADSTEIASNLLEVFRGKVGLHEMVTIDVPEVVNKIEWIESITVQKEEPVVRMYSNGCAGTEPEKIFSVVFDFG